MSERRTSPQRSLLLVGLALAASSAALFVGCDSADSNNPSPSGGTAGTGTGGPSDPFSGPCDTEGETHDCSVHHEAGCTSGSQTCLNGTWTACEPPATTNRSGEGKIGRLDLDHRAGTCPIPDIEFLVGAPDSCTSDNQCQFDSHCVGSVCVPWGFAATDPACTGANDIDITITIPCNGEFQVCNRGTATITDDIDIKSQPIGTLPGGVGTSTSDPGGTACQVPGGIEPGECETVPVDCWGGSAGRQILPGDWIFAYDVDDECNPYNNWSYYDAAGTCGECFGAGGGGAPKCGDDSTRDNVCDPECHATLPGNPDFGGSATGVVSGTTSELCALQPPVCAVGMDVPCNSSDDCQFDTYCDDVTSTCVPYAPGQTNDDCPADDDLTLGVPCTAGAIDYVVVCNRGGSPRNIKGKHIDYLTSTATAGDRAAAESNVGNNSCGSIGAPHKQIKLPDVTLSPGECVNVDATTAGGNLTGTAPYDGAWMKLHASDCQCSDNWSWFQRGLSCAAPTCGTTTNTAEEVPITLFLALDISGSMETHRDCPYARTVRSSENCNARNCTGTCTLGGDSGSSDDDTCSTHEGLLCDDSGGRPDSPCCWGAEVASESRWGTIHGALETFVQDPGSAGLGVAVKFWSEGQCADDQCSALGNFIEDIDSGTCAHDICTAGGALASGCATNVNTVCADDPTCCGSLPQGTCSHDACTAGAALTTACMGSLPVDVCSGGNNIFDRCCGEWAGNCGTDPCVVGAHKSGCNNGSNTGIQTTCTSAGFESCCNNAVVTAKRWGLSRAPCTAATGLAMQCRNGSGGSGTNVACTSVGSPPAGTLAFYMKAFQALPANTTCATSWTATCVTAFRAYMSSPVTGIGHDLCANTWDAGCVTKWTNTVGATACTKSWDAACVTQFQSLAGAGACTLGGWDADCITAYEGASGLDCTPADSTTCNHPSVPASCDSVDTCRLELTADPAPTDTAEQQVLDTLDLVTPNNGTPSAAALEGATDFCERYQALHPDEKCVVVFVSDGQPSRNCTATASDEEDYIWSIANDANTAGVTTFAIGIGAAGTAFMDGIAFNGGTDDAIFVSADGTAAADFLAALEDIRNTFACAYTLPSGANISTVSVQWQNSGTDPMLKQVADAAACDTDPDCDGSAESKVCYFPTSGTEIGLCPETCTMIRGEVGSSVEIVNPCSATPGPVEVTQTLSAGDVCAEYPGTYPKWTVMFYTADVPVGSSILVEARTDLLGPFTSIMTINDVNDTTGLTSPASLQTPLGPDAFGPEIEIKFTSDAAGGVPTVTYYEPQFTCEYTE